MLMLSSHHLLNCNCHLWNCVNNLHSCFRIISQGNSDLNNKIRCYKSMLDVTRDMLFVVQVNQGIDFSVKVYVKKLICRVFV